MMLNSAVIHSRKSCREEERDFTSFLLFSEGEKRNQEKERKKRNPNFATSTTT